MAPPSLASQMTVPGAVLNAGRSPGPAKSSKPSPGLIVTQHSGEGKANQYFLRGYNLDHGTDLAITVDDMPVNMRTHAHGQGYADLNWLIPETVNSLAIRKGPYFADVGDFGSAGSLAHRPHRPARAQHRAGDARQLRLSALFRHGRRPRRAPARCCGPPKPAPTTDPGSIPTTCASSTASLRYSQGTATDGFTVTGMAYTNKWNSTDQVPERALARHEIDRFGSEDTSDGGNTNRFSLSARFARTDDAGSWKANAYVIKSDLDLYNDFTYFLSNPVLGDQFHQHDDRVVAGANASRTINGSFAGRPVETTFGIQTRYDAIELGLTDTFQRAFLSNVRSDKVGEGSVGGLWRKHRALDRVAAHHARLARRRLCGDGRFDL